MALNNVVIIGGGIAGLCAAIHCERRGLDWTLLEASDRLGGRVGSRIIDGCRIDRGFAVLLTAYPELRGMIDLEQLDLRAFSPEREYSAAELSFELRILCVIQLVA